MKVWNKTLVALVALTALGSQALPAAAGDVSTASTTKTTNSAGPTAADDVVAKLDSVPGLTVVDEATAPQGYRFFHLTFTQPVDHRHPNEGTFEQRLTLLHKDFARPNVMFTSGYSVSDNPRAAEPTKIIDGNQISMEYRFFPPSIPAKPDWPKQLTIWQAATDEHRIIEAFRPLYNKNWLTTGASKGGMTATYHRRFYPHDVQGSVPYVAPNDVVDDVDVYDDFLDNVGDDPQCRQQLKRFQRESLRRRGELLALARKESTAKEFTYHTVGSLDRGFEVAVIDSYFAFWQYQQQADCAKIPAAGASAADMYAFYDKVESLTTYSDQALNPYTAYYYQAAYQLGSPEAYDSYLRDLLRHPGIDQPRTFIPRELRGVRHDRSAMPDIDRWVRTQSNRMLYIYGSNDPWSAEPFDCGAHGEVRDCHRYYVPGGNHGSSIAQLPEEQKLRATALVRTWAGLDSSTAASRAAMAKIAPAPQYTRRGRI